MGAVDEYLPQIEASAFPEVLGQVGEYSDQGPVLYPLLEAAMAGLVWRVLAGQLVPRSTGFQDPQDA